MVANEESSGTNQPSLSTVPRQHDHAPSLPTSLYVRAMAYGDHYIWFQKSPMNLPHMDGFRSTSVIYASDFALVELNSTIMPYNFFGPPYEGDIAYPNRRYVVERPSLAWNGPILVLLPGFEALPGVLLEENALFMNRSGAFKTKKIRTERKLGSFPQHKSEGRKLTDY